jgi:hypothetical protein
LRFGDLEGLSALAVEQLYHRFRNEEVLTVLPVRAAGSALDSLLVATATMLAILTSEPEPNGGWTTRWAPWDAVRFADMGAAAMVEDMFFLTIVVHRTRFHAELHGESGRRALRDFVVVVERCRGSLAATR